MAWYNNPEFQKYLSGAAQGVTDVFTGVTPQDRMQVDLRRWALEQDRLRREEYMKHLERQQSSMNEYRQELIEDRKRKAEFDEAQAGINFRNREMSKSREFGGMLPTESLNTPEATNFNELLKQQRAMQQVGEQLSDWQDKVDKGTFSDADQALVGAMVDNFKNVSDEQNLIPNVFSRLENSAKSLLESGIQQSNLNKERQDLLVQSQRGVIQRREQEDFSKVRKEVTLAIDDSLKGANVTLPSRGDFSSVIENSAVNVGEFGKEFKSRMGETGVYGARFASLKHQIATDALERGFGSPGLTTKQKSDIATQSVDEFKEQLEDLMKDIKDYFGDSRNFPK